mmetsp:Transcript_21514/g.54200  ORF Transcript_21514/g.54200 Transcript_21514/m.54200 type:complete len:201 (+) Transcript_21514:1606-2208(+)
MQEDVALSVERSRPPGRAVDLQVQIRCCRKEVGRARERPSTLVVLDREPAEAVALARFVPLACAHVKLAHALFSHAADVCLVVVRAHQDVHVAQHGAADVLVTASASAHLEPPPCHFLYIRRLKCTQHFRQLGRRFVRIKLEQLCRALVHLYLAQHQRHAERDQVAVFATDEVDHLLAKKTRQLRVCFLRGLQRERLAAT